MEIEVPKVNILQLIVLESGPSSKCLCMNYYNPKCTLVIDIIHICCSWTYRSTFSRITHHLQNMYSQSDASRRRPMKGTHGASEEVTHFTTRNFL